MKNPNSKFMMLMIFAAALVSCDDDDNTVAIHELQTADKVSVDRFSATAGHLMVRNGSNGLPAANAPIDFDQGPFITKGLGPDGQTVEYYNFDVQPVEPAPIYVLFKAGSTSPVAGQLNIINVIPGDVGYNDFWLVNKVTVPADYQANEVASLDEIVYRGYPIEATTMLVNCPVVPDGSTATKRLSGASGLIQGWYKEKIVTYFTFDEKMLETSAGKVPLSPIYVCFNINPSESNGGPPSGFKTENSSDQTHNVVATIPSNVGYSPLWLVNAYDTDEFGGVSNLMTAQSAASVGSALATVNCPVVTVQ